MTAHHPLASPLPPGVDPPSILLHLRDGQQLLALEYRTRRTVLAMNPEGDGLGQHLQRLFRDGMTTGWPDWGVSQLQAAIAARTEAVRTGGSPDLALFGRIALGLNRSERWTAALSTALLGDWASPLHDGTGLGPTALDRLRSEARTIHRQLVPLWRRRSGGRRVFPLETPVHGGTTLRDLLADQHLPCDPVLDQVPGDRRLAAVLARLAPTERDVVLALGRPGVTTWAEAAELVGSTQPDPDGEKVRRKVGRVVRELRRRDGQRADGPTGLWTAAPNGGAR